MGDLATVSPKLSKLILLLSSNQDGEVVAAARAIGRTLSGAGMDWHNLVKALTTPPVPPANPSNATSSGPKAKAYSPPRPSPGPPRWRSLDSGERLMHLDYICYMGSLSPWERSFAKSIEALLETRPYATLSPKQIQILDSLLAKEWEETR